MGSALILAAFVVMTGYMPVSALGGASGNNPGKPRLIVLTDITNEPDDEQSMVRLLTYANELEIEALIATTSCWLRNDTAPEKIIERIDAYGSVRENLMVHASGWPTAESLKAKVKSGVKAFGMAGVGGSWDSDGSRLIIQTVDKDDPRPVYVSIWGGANCLAQAIWHVERNRSKLELDQFIAKLRVYTISDQDDAGPWMRARYPNLFYIVSPGYEEDGGNAYHFSTWVGISGDKFHGRFQGADFSIVDNPWLEKHIRHGHGPLGAMYPKTKYLMEGDTPSFFWVIPNGLSVPDRPDWGGWGGRYELSIPPPKKYYHRPEVRPVWTNADDEIVGVDGNYYTSNQATIWRWREGYQHDFAARIDWSNTSNFEDANHPPRVRINGNATKAPYLVEAKSGDSIQFSTKGTEDPDGDDISFKWYSYPEAGTLPLGASTLPEGNHNKSSFRYSVPQVENHGSLHIILEVTDNGTPTLTSYRRIIVNVTP